MNDSSLSSAELLLINLSDHQVIRIEGSAQWMKYLTGQVKQTQPDTFEIKGSLALDVVQDNLAKFLQVEAGASFVQQELERWLQQERRLHVIVNSDDVCLEALTYLLSLPSICNETGPAVTVILLSTTDMVSALKSSTLLASKLDGYYQEDVDLGSVSASSNKALITFGVLAFVCLTAGGWYWFNANQDFTDPKFAVANVAELSQNVDDTKAVQPTQNTQVVVASSPHDYKQTQLVITEENVGATAVDPSVITVEPELVVKSPESDVIPKKLNPELVASLTATVEKAKQKRDKTSQILVNTTAKVKTQESVKVDELVKVAKAEPKEVATSEQLNILAQTKIASPITKNQRTAESVTELPVKPGPKENNEKAVREVFTTWHTAWEQQNWDDYINSYLQNSTLYGVKMSLEEWRAFRKDRLLSPEWIKLEIKFPKFTRLNSHWYRVEFYQRFEKPGYADETKKRLEFMLTSAGWKIASEATNGTVVLKRPTG
ncbi:hypothetical protein ACMXYR_03920 [Neptuniibacter sp. QD29_5]|uniref:L,D-transpeptidase Cds6 family protein n=1 Tax=Neptuniibacter sp. QD29_5 TaxID=3398207 RepID=UPI0039F62EBB